MAVTLPRRHRAASLDGELIDERHNVPVAGEQLFDEGGALQRGAQEGAELREALRPCQIGAQRLGERARRDAGLELKLTAGAELFHEALQHATDQGAHAGRRLVTMCTRPAVTTSGEGSWCSQAWTARGSPLG